MVSTAYSWIPVFTGMTKGKTGMTKEKERMTKKRE